MTLRRFSIPDRHRLRRPARGYTAVEVLMAITVMAIGASAVMSMQKATVLGNLDARKADVANSIARIWVERLERDAMQWTMPGPTTGAGSNMATAAVIANGIANAGHWVLPDQYIALSQPMSPGFDILGRDLPKVAPLGAPDLSQAIFCVNVRTTWLTAGELIRADMRVLWARGISNGPPTGWCASSLGDRPDPSVYHSIYLTTALRGNPQ